MKVHGIIEETWLKFPNCFPLPSHGSSSLFTPTVRCQCSINARENPLGSEGEPHQNSISGPSWCFHRKNSLIFSFIKQNQIILLCQMLVKWRYYWKFLNYLAAAAAKLIQSCPTLCDPMDSSPPGFSVHGIFQARVLEWVTIAFFLNYPTWTWNWPWRNTLIPKAIQWFPLLFYSNKTQTSLPVELQPNHIFTSLRPCQFPFEAKRFSDWELLSFPPPGTFCPQHFK